ncbi:MAG: hypothetical protein J2P43_15270 [Candidatus Dormibacteraeota bacterium]|nr:hypothetical protein [Candidatus Dormibacteraeota bacterium]
MAEIVVEEDRVVVHVQGVDRILALTTRLEVPLAHVVGAAPDEVEARRWWHGVREPGVDVPHVLTAGRFLQHGDLVFWDVRGPEGAISVELRHEQYAKLVIGVEDPGSAVDLINAAVRELNSDE